LTDRERNSVLHSGREKKRKIYQYIKKKREKESEREREQERERGRKRCTTSSCAHLVFSCSCTRKATTALMTNDPDCISQHPQQTITGKKYKITAKYQCTAFAHATPLQKASDTSKSMT
jgi:hypothetical protein